MEIRSLINRDLFTVVGMLKKTGEIAGSEKLSELFSAAAGDSAKKDINLDKVSTRLGFLVLSELYDKVSDDLQNWFASLCSKKLDEFMEMPAETTLEIIDQLVHKEDTRRFFSRAWELYKKIASLKTPFTAK